MELSRRRKRRAFFRGASSVFDLFGSSYRSPRFPTDAAALSGDWDRVGDDLRSAMRGYPIRPHRD